MRISTDSENKDEVLKSDQLKHEENFENQLENIIKKKKIYILDFL
jgi:hypothetical protein